MMEKTGNATPSFDFVEHFRTSGLHPSVTDVSEFFRLMAKSAREAFKADMVTIWDNNVYGDCLVLLGTSPQAVPERLHQTMPRDLSYTGLVIERCDVVMHDNLTRQIGKRRFIDLDTFSDLGLSHMLSIPVYNPFNSQLVTFVIDLYFAQAPDPEDWNDARGINWLIRFLGLALDYLLYKVDEVVHYSVEMVRPSVSGTSSLFEAVLPRLKELTRCSDATLFRWYPDREELLVEMSSDAEAKVVKHPGRQAEPEDATPRLILECVEKKRAFMSEEPVKNEGTRADKDAHAEQARWSCMATPILSGSGQVLGVLQCKHNQERPYKYSFSSLDLYTLEGFARALGPSMERFIRVREDSILRNVMQDVIQAALHADRMEDILQKTIETLVEKLHAATGSIYVLEEKGGQEPKLVMRAGVGPDSPLIGVAEYRIGEGITGDIANSDILNFKTREQRRGYHSRREKYNSRMLTPKEFKKDNSEAFLGVPIKMRGKVLGIWKIEYLKAWEAHPEPYFTDEDEQMAHVISAFLAYVIENGRYARNEKLTLRRFKLLAESSVEIERARTEEDAVFAVMNALEKSGWVNAMYSSYDESTRHIKGIFPLGELWGQIVEKTDRDIDGPHILAHVLRSNRPEFIKDSSKDSRCDQALVALVKAKAQYVIPLRLDDEMIGTLQIDMGSKTHMEEEEEKLLQAFASHLTVAISRIRNVKKAVNLTNQVLSSSRFIIAENLSSNAVHSLDHKLADMVQHLDVTLKRPEIRQYREVLEVLSDLRKQLFESQKDLKGALQLVKAGASEKIVKPIDVHPLIQQAIDIWYTMLDHNNCKVQVSAEAAQSVCCIRQHAFLEILSVLIVNSVQAYAKKIEITTYNMEEIEISPGKFMEQDFCLDFSDNGTGILSDAPEELFEPSYTTKPEKFGTGLGLFIARRLARGAGGDLLVVYPNTKSKGATFRLVLPVMSVD